MKTTRFEARSRGQVMVLGCVALVVLALMLMTSFTVSNAIHEKIRIQSHADAQAYSLAVVEARAFNTTAYYNRAIAAALVAQMSLHSWMSIATHDVAMLSAGAMAMLAIAGIETAMGCYPYNFSHCPCVIQALISAFKFFRAARQWGNTLKGLESQFNKGVKGLREMVDSLYKGQVKALQAARGELMMGQVLQQLKSKNASGSNYVMMLQGMNDDEFKCALEGTDFDGCSKSSAATRSKIIQNTANATRPLFDRMGVMSSMVSHQNFRGPMNPDVPKDQLTDGRWMHFFATRARVGEGTSSGSSSGHQAKNVGAGAMGMGVATIIGFKHVPIMAMPFNGEIFSGQSNKHSGLIFMNGHQGQHTEFEEIPQDPCNDKNCFVNFNADPDPDNDFGQPTVYGGVTQSLRMRTDKSGTNFSEGAPWEINQSGEVAIAMVDSKPAKIKLIPRGDGIAVSKAKVYFHQLGDWKVSPNFFDPFWRAKLHFFKKQELNDVLTRAGDMNGVMMLNAGGPVEGEDQ
jgi:hypothetical protein